MLSVPDGFCALLLFLVSCCLCLFSCSFFVVLLWCLCVGVVVLFCFYLCLALWFRAVISCQLVFGVLPCVVFLASCGVNIQSQLFLTGFCAVRAWEHLTLHFCFFLDTIGFVRVASGCSVVVLLLSYLFAYELVVL